MAEEEHVRRFPLLAAPWLGRQSDWWVDRGRAIVVRTGRLTAAAVLAYVVAHALFPKTEPLTGPLTALLVVQATLFSTLKMGLQRVLSVVSGVLIAVLLAEVVGLTWWSLGLVIACALIIGQVLRLEDQLLEVPISAMLILGVGAAATTAAGARIAETLVGAGIGVLINVVFPPPLRTRNADEAVQQVAEQTANLLIHAAHQLLEHPSKEQAVAWLQDARQLSRFVDRADQAISEGSASRRLNPRSIRHLDTEPILRSGLEALEHTIIALRAVFRSIADGIAESEEAEDAEEAEEVEARQGGGPYGSDLLAAFGVLLDELAQGIRAYGALVRADARTGGQGSEAALGEALESLGEARAVLTELLLVRSSDDRHAWMLSGSLLASVDRVLRELDLEERTRQRERWAQRWAQRRDLRARLKGTTRAAAARARRRRKSRPLDNG
ncbi:MAG TPA: aromatic acid exporter family protein [Actinomycetales bacterium]|nr:aromatic acid exporter family protein [Actinomycetales bacterium]